MSRVVSRTAEAGWTEACRKRIDQLSPGLNAIYHRPATTLSPRANGRGAGPRNPNLVEGPVCHAAVRTRRRFRARLFSAARPRSENAAAEGRGLGHDAGPNNRRARGSGAGV